MKLTNAQMFDSLQVLTQAEEKGVLGYAIARNRRKLADELKEYLAKRDELLREHGTDDGTGKFTFTLEAAQAFSAELRPFAEMTADVAVHQITADEFCSGGLTSSQMYALEWMVKEDET
ncbi:MAG: hypothetical protein IKY65_04510 [Rikenellaceae bacterium]|nr:hypothetical protein [Rikenellaceae bacterium]